MHRRLGEIFVRELEMSVDTLVGISRVRVTQDLKNAKIFISVIPFEKRNTALNLVKKQRGRIQKELNKHLTMKFTPKLEFLVDTTEEDASHIDNILDRE